MQNFLFMAHSGWRYIVLVAVIAAIGYGVYGFLTNQRWNDTARKIMLFATIAIDIQFLLGLILYVVRKGWEEQWGAGSRFEHPFFMLLALAVMHIVSGRTKKIKIERSRYQVMAMGTLVAVLLVVGGILRLTGGSMGRVFGMG
ncbi:MAG: hypothetical protein KAX40_01225 [Herpetosiphon sp.]|nr:hypothetical protein [Herpetosiphon sp.]